MRVLITASTLPRWPGDAIPGFVLDQALALRAHDPTLEIEILAPHDAGAALDEVWQGIRVRRFRYVWPPRLAQLAYPAILPNLRRRPWLVLQVPMLIAAELVAVLRVARRRRPDVIYSHWFTPQALVGAAVGALLGIPHVFTTHSADAEVLQRLPLAGPALARAVARRARAGTAVSRRTLGKLLAFFPDAAERERIAARLMILPMGVSTATFLPPSAERRAALRASLGLDDKEAILFLGRLSEKKGVPVLLRALARLGASRPALVLCIAGEGEERPALEHAIAKLGLGDRVRMLGHLQVRAKAEWLEAVDVLVIPSIETAHGDAEGLPVVLLEGLAAGQVCVASDASGAEEVLTNGADGFITPAGDEHALAVRIAGVLDLEPAARERIAAAARRRGADFDWRTIAAAHHRHLLAPR